jgi:SAM-dependent methyltransferase
VGQIFDRKAAMAYDSWRRSSQGRTIDRALERLIPAFLDPKKGERVLDIGCGSGNHMIALSKLGLDVCGIDASPYMIDQARERLGQHCILRKGRAEDLPFDDNEFDLAVLITTLEFLDDPLQALREAGRVANRKVFVGVLNSLSWNGLTRKVQGLFGDSLFAHARFFNLWGLKSLIRQAYGPVPITWGCIRIGPSLVDEVGLSGKVFLDWKHSPFACFLTMSATMVYRVKADNLPLRIKMKEATHTLIRAKTLEDLSHSKGAHGDERGLPV